MKKIRAKISKIKGIIKPTFRAKYCDCLKTKGKLFNF